MLSKLNLRSWTHSSSPCRFSSFPFLGLELIVTRPLPRWQTFGGWWCRSSPRSDRPSCHYVFRRRKSVFDLLRQLQAIPRPASLYLLPLPVHRCKSRSSSPFHLFDQRHHYIWVMYVFVFGLERGKGRLANFTCGRGWVPLKRVERGWRDL